MLAIYDPLGRAIGHPREGWLFDGAGENDLVGTFRATLPGPGLYSFAITAEDGQTCWTDLLRATETDGVLHLWPDRIPLESFPHAVAPVLSSDGRLPALAGLAANAASRSAPKLRALGGDPRKSLPFSGVLGRQNCRFCQCPPVRRKTTPSPIS